jgi:hypothetical protein
VKVRGFKAAAVVWLVAMFAVFFVLARTSTPGEWWYYPADAEGDPEGSFIAVTKAFILVGGLGSVLFWLGYLMRGKAR